MFQNITYGIWVTETFSLYIPKNSKEAALTLPWGGGESNGKVDTEAE